MWMIKFVEGAKMSQKHLNLIYAIKDGIGISIESVESGLKCNCTCPSCGAVLVAKKGSKMIHHFAHHSVDDCEYGYETSLHLAAKDIISKAQKITVPPVYVSFPDSPKRDELYYESREINIDKVELEKKFGNIIPDIVIHTCGKIFYLEIYVTHKIDEAKLAKIKKANISTIEVDLSSIDRTITYKDLKNILLSDSKEKAWKYNVAAENKLKQFYANADKRTLMSRGFAIHVDNCPIKIRTWKGRAYANFIDDCMGCQYCISTNKDIGLLCSGRTRIASIKDFDIPQNIRIENSNAEIRKSKQAYIVSGYCPNCSHKLVKRHGKFGSFLGCSNYPHCKFTIAIDAKTEESIKP